ncbi:MAG: sigma factor-like helix-turn-helix DNA-binding protein [Nakamurella sp.]
MSDLPPGNDPSQGRQAGDGPPDSVPTTATGKTPLTVAGDPRDRVTLDASLTTLLMTVLDSLTPAKRVAFLLHDVFGVSYTTISEIVGRSPAATRSLARTARRQVHYRPVHDDNPSGKSFQLSDRKSLTEHDFFLAGAMGDQKQLELLFDPAITVLIDTGGIEVSSVDPVRGRPAAAALIINLLVNDRTIDATEQSVNGRAGLVLRRAGRVVSVVIVEIRDDLVRDMWIVANPDKLRQWNAD